MDVKTIKHYLKQLTLCSDDFEVASEIIDCLLNEKLTTVFRHTTIATRKLFLKKASRCIQEDRFDEAQPILEQLMQYVKKYENKTECKQFQNIFEYYYYFVTVAPSESITIPEEPILYYLLFYGLLLVQQHKNDEAIEIFKKVIAYNPYCAEAYFEMADVYRKQDNLDLFYETIKQVYHIAYDPYVLAKYYRNIGFYFVEKKDYQFAKMAYFVSSHYENHPNVSHELAYISMITNEDIVAPSLLDIQEAFFEKGLNPVPNDRIIAFLLNMGELMEESEPNNAILMYDMYIALTENEEIKQRVKEIRRKMKLNA